MSHVEAPCLADAVGNWAWRWVRRVDRRGVRVSKCRSSMVGCAVGTWKRAGARKMAFSVFPRAIEVCKASSKRENRDNIVIDRQCGVVVVVVVVETGTSDASVG